MELPEIIGSIILLFSAAVCLLFTFSYLIYKLKNQTRLKIGFEKIQEVQATSKQLKNVDIKQDQLNKPVFSNVDDKVQFKPSNTANRFKIINEVLKS